MLTLLWRSPRAMASMSLPFLSRWFRFRYHNDTPLTCLETA